MIFGWSVLQLFLWVSIAQKKHLMKDPLIGFEKDSKMESTEMLCDLWCLRVSK